MRVFAGPNGSGKSTMYREVAATKINGKPIDLGIYLNPDEITKELKEVGRLDLKEKFGIGKGPSSLFLFAKRSGLLSSQFTDGEMKRGYSFSGNVFILLDPTLADRFAQLLTAFLCHRLIHLKRKFSFETVFSHESKLDLMRKARTAGYKVYLYFIATEDPAINKDRVKTRVEQGGHDVPAALIEKRYHRSLAQLKDAMDLAYHAFLFDNTGLQPRLFAEYKTTLSGSALKIGKGGWPSWFVDHYVLKLPGGRLPELLGVPLT